MNNLNSVLIDGNLCADPEVRETPKGTLVCNFRLASNRYYRQDTELQEEANFFDVETWAKSAERCRDKLSKGRNVRVVGRLKHDRWSDDQGNPRSRVKIVADHVELGPQPKSVTAESNGESSESRAVESDEKSGAKDAELQEVPF